jgi:HTH-type transcriptional regulator/antitoxin HipB
MRSARINDPSELGVILREARIAKGLSQRELASRLGVAQKYIVELEAGKPTKAIDRLFEFALATDITFRAESRIG